MKLFQIRAIPHSFIIGKGRKILYHHRGFKKKDEEILRKKLKSLLKTVPTQDDPEKSEESE